MNRDEFFSELWTDFVSIAPHAGKLAAAFEERGEHLQNDHVAFRTFDRGPSALVHLEPHILALGYRVFDEYRFEEKRLRARAYTCDGAPRIFLSELLVDEMPTWIAETIDGCLSHVTSVQMGTARALCAGRLWPALPFATYEAMSAVSEYAAWLCALGFRANHFTVSVNALKTLDGLTAVLDFVESNGYRINESGGRVKGSRDVFLEQGSTMADQVQVDFADGPHVIPSCYYEFALRHPLPDGVLYQGFVAGSADKIFESTHRQAPPTT